MLPSEFTSSVLWKLGIHFGNHRFKLIMTHYAAEHIAPHARISFLLEKRRDNGNCLETNNCFSVCPSLTMYSFRREAMAAFNCCFVFSMVLATQKELNAHLLNEWRNEDHVVNSMLILLITECQSLGNMFYTMSLYVNSRAWTLASLFLRAQNPIMIWHMQKDRVLVG